MPPLLSITGFQKKYPSGFQLRLDQLILEQGIHLILGENGSGKSTFLKALAGIHPADGELILQGFSLQKSPLEYRTRLGYAEAEPVFPPFLNLDDLIEVVAIAKKSPEGQAQVLKETFGVQGYANYPIGTYSSGMVKKAALVLAFLGNPQLIILDEPFTTIDAASQEILSQVILEKARSGISFLLTSHQSSPIDHLPIGSKLLVQNGSILPHG